MPSAPSVRPGLTREEEEEEEEERAGVTVTTDYFIGKEAQDQTQNLPSHEISPCMHACINAHNSKASCRDEAIAVQLPPANHLGHLKLTLDYKGHLKQL